MIHIPSNDFARNNSRRKPKPTVKARVKAGIDEEFRKMFDRARANVDKALTAGDRQVSMWFIDVYLKRNQSRIAFSLTSTVSTPEGLKSLSEEAMTLAKEGKIPFYQLKQIQEAIARHMILNDSTLIADLRRDIDDLTAAMQSKTHGKDHMPAWGRLRAITSQPPVIDHEDDEDDPMTIDQRESGGDDDEPDDPRVRNLMDD